MHKEIHNIDNKCAIDKTRQIRRLTDKQDMADKAIKTYLCAAFWASRFGLTRQNSIT